MDKDVDIRAYFAQHAHEAFNQRLVNMASKQMVRAGIESMKILCGMTVEEIVRTRNIGEKSQEVVLTMREKYAQENQIRLS